MVRVGDIVSGTVMEIGRSFGAAVRLDGELGAVTAGIGPLDVSWRVSRDEAVQVGRRVTAEVVGIDAQRVRLSLAATENPELWRFLKGLRVGQVLAGVVADIQPFGVFVALEQGPPHPVYPGVGFVTIPELSWRPIEQVTDVVQVGQQVHGAFLGFDTVNGEARMSLRALQPDPFQLFADRAHLGQRLSGPVTRVLPIGVVIEVAEGVHGLLHKDELFKAPVDAPEQIVQGGDILQVAIAELDHDRRRLRLSRAPIP
ncbi:S1 RNA-binding domain-containing protein [Spirillospora sp. CA-253888]